MALRSLILKNAVGLVPALGFTRLAITEAAANVTTHEKLPERSLEVLFGKGDELRKTLIRAWLDEGRIAMGSTPTTVRDALHKRLDWNSPVLEKLPEAYALLATPTGPVPSINLKAVVEHPARVAHSACRLAQTDQSGVAWYTERAALATIYATAELHQLTSPQTAARFLDGLLELKAGASNAMAESSLFAGYIGRSWLGIARSQGLLP
ncbi:hypothetical protein M408DRAFT_329991 [Serendipita vermifera MAFF 305830]|uniref:COQ9 C-terminal domain-containing protein n=1 Tax=Serendipita vermifera MAFF 305830 TaxID=933852 RepID=A0A0C2WMQ5_SERVB|nr:hypothetical protein M408DRAFT_329991 [Serendipita vermifera MAFF 305830]